MSQFDRYMKHDLKPHQDPLSDCKDCATINVTVRDRGNWRPVDAQTRQPSHVNNTRDNRALAGREQVRGPGRWEFKVPFESPWVDEETFNNLAVRGVMRRLVGRKAESRMEIDT